MARLRKLLGALWAVWCALWGILTLLAVSPIYPFLTPRSPARAHSLSRAWAAALRFTWGIRLKVEGQEILQPAQAYIFVCNHRSYLDIPVAAGTTRHFFRFLAKKELGDIPLLGPIISKLYITVQREDRRSSVASYVEMKKSLAAGVSVWIFPEGTRNKTDAPLLPLHEGAFRLSKDTGKPIAIACFWDTRRHMPAKGFAMYPGTVFCRWRQVLNPHDFEGHAQMMAAAEGILSWPP